MTTEIKGTIFRIDKSHTKGKLVPYNIRSRGKKLDLFLKFGRFDSFEDTHDGIEWSTFNDPDEITVTVDGIVQSVPANDMVTGENHMIQARVEGGGDVTATWMRPTGSRER